MPQVDEIEALLAGRRLTCIVYFLDETFEELQYDITSTVLEAVEQARTHGLHCVQLSSALCWQRPTCTVCCLEMQSCGTALSVLCWERLSSMRHAWHALTAGFVHALCAA